MFYSFLKSACSSGLVAFISIGAASCGGPEKKKPEPVIVPQGAPGVLEIRFLDARSNVPLKGVVVEVSYQGVLIATATSSDLGIAVIRLNSGEGSRGTQYTIQAKLEGYLNYTYENVDVIADSRNGIEAPLLVNAQDNGKGSISGKVLDSTNNDPLKNTEVRLCAGGNKVCNAPIQRVVADEYGSFRFSELEAGVYTVEASKDKFSITRKTVVTFKDYIASNANLLLSPLLQDGQYRIVLTWGPSPLDLDSHTLRSGEKPFEVYFRSKKYADETVELDLDVDDTSSFGPETTTIRVNDGKPFRYFVNNYSGSPSLTTSAALVQIYDKNGLKNRFTVPTTECPECRLWDVFELEGSNIKVINKLVNQKPATR